MLFRAPANSGIESLALPGDVLVLANSDGVFDVPDDQATRVMGLGWEIIGEAPIEGLTASEVSEILAIVNVAFRRMLAAKSVEKQREILDELRASTSPVESVEQIEGELEFVPQQPDPIAPVIVEPVAELGAPVLPFAPDLGGGLHFATGEPEPEQKAVEGEAAPGAPVAATGEPEPTAG